VLNDASAAVVLPMLTGHRARPEAVAPAGPPMAIAGPVSSPGLGCRASARFPGSRQRVRRAGMGHGIVEPRRNQRAVAAIATRGTEPRVLPPKISSMFGEAVLSPPGHPIGATGAILDDEAHSFRMRPRRPLRRGIVTPLQSAVAGQRHRRLASKPCDVTMPTRESGDASHRVSFLSLPISS